MITKKDVEHIAKLARINLTNDEETKLGGELSEILGFVEKLNEIDTSDIQPMTGGTSLKNIWREDESRGGLDTKPSELIEAAPDQKESWIRVRSVFEE